MRLLLSGYRKNLRGHHPGQDLPDLLSVGLRYQLPELVQGNLAGPLFSGDLSSTVRSRIGFLLEVRGIAAGTILPIPATPGRQF